TANRQEPLARSTNTTAGRPSTAARTRSSRVSRSQPVLLTGTSAPGTPLICSAACTKASAREPWHTTTPCNSSLIVLLQILPQAPLFFHSLNQTGIERRGDVDSRVPQEMHHRHHL